MEHIHITELSIFVEPLIERRITLRLLAYWEKLREGRAMPSENDVNPEDISDLWDSCFMVQVRDLAQAACKYSYLGTAIIEAYLGDLKDNETNPVFSLDAKKLRRGYNRVIESRRPVLEEGEFHNLRGDLVRYRQCLMPLGQGDKVEAIFGGMRCKLFTAEPS